MSSLLSGLLCHKYPLPCLACNVVSACLNSATKHFNFVSKIQTMIMNWFLLSPLLFCSDKHCVSSYTPNYCPVPKLPSLFISFHALPISCRFRFWTKSKFSCFFCRYCLCFYKHYVYLRTYLVKYFSIGTNVFVWMSHHHQVVANASVVISIVHLNSSILE